MVTRGMQAFGLPLPLMAACAACEGGVKRTHLLDAATEGALLLELYSRDGIGAMISTDFYEVPAHPGACWLDEGRMLLWNRVYVYGNKFSKITMLLFVWTY